MSDMRHLIESMDKISEAGPIKKPGDVMGYEMGGSSGAVVGGGGVPNVGTMARLPTLTKVVKPGTPPATPVTRPPPGKDAGAASAGSRTDTVKKDTDPVGSYKPGGEKDTLGRREPGTGTDNPFLPPAPKPIGLKKPAAATAAIAAGLYLADKDKKPPPTSEPQNLKKPAVDAAPDDAILYPTELNKDKMPTTGGSAGAARPPANANGQPQVDGTPSPTKIDLPTVGPQGSESPFYVMPTDTTPKPLAPAPAPVAPIPKPPAPAPAPVAPEIKLPAPAPIAPAPIEPAPGPITPSWAPATKPSTATATPSTSAASGSGTGQGSGSGTGTGSGTGPGSDTEYRDGDSIETKLRRNKFIKETAVQKLLNNFTKFIESSTKNKSKAK